jgi:hypothetical protein
MALMLRHPGAEEVEEPVYVGGRREVPSVRGGRSNWRWHSGGGRFLCGTDSIAGMNIKDCVEAGCSKEQESLRQPAG